MKKKEDEPKKGAPAYMNTYGDMMTLLLTFFVLLFSMSTVDAAKFKAMVASFDGAAGLLAGGETLQEDTNMLGNGVIQFPTQQNTAEHNAAESIKEQQLLEQTKKNIENYIEEKNLQDKVDIEKQGDEIILRFDDILLFDTAKADIKPGAIPVLNTVGIKLKEYLEQGYQLRFEGHTDNRPIHTAQFPSNRHLSAARAISVSEFFVTEMDFDPVTISTEGYGEYRPIADNKTEKGQAMNRRVEIKMSKESKS